LFGDPDVSAVPTRNCQHSLVAIALRRRHESFLSLVLDCTLLLLKALQNIKVEQPYHARVANMTPLAQLVERIAAMLKAPFNKMVGKHPCET